MNSKRLGDTDVELPEIGFGTFYYKGGTEPLREAVRLGASLIDTAEVYGTEEVIGSAIKGIRDRVFLATKVSPTHFRRPDVLRAAEGSLERLQTDHIDLYQLHRPNYTIPIEETMAAMEELVDRGQVRFIGVSNFSVRELKKAQAALSRYRIVANQVRYSLVDRTIETDLLEYCQRNRITVIAYSPLGRGLDHLKEMDPSNTLDTVAVNVGKTIAQVVLNWCISKDGVIAIPKADLIGHVEEDCGASGWGLPAAEEQLLEQVIACRRRGYVVSGARRLARRCLQRLRYRNAF